MRLGLGDGSGKPLALGERPVTQKSLDRGKR